MNVELGGPTPSRRDFLAVSAMGVLGLATAASGLSRRAPSPADGALLFVGTYTEGKRTEGIHLVRLDARTGALGLTTSVDAGPEPSFIALHPNGRVLYAVNEVMERGGIATGSLRAFAIAGDAGELTLLDEQLSEGSAPCYVSLDAAGRVALVANYMGGNVAVLPIQPDGSLASASHVVQHIGTGPDAARQEAAHAHCAMVDPSNRFVLAADLGVDRVLVYRLDAEAGSLRHLETADAVMRPGSGPRHLAFHPTRPLVYVANELDSTVTTLSFDSPSGKLSALDTRSTLPSGWTGTNYPADIHVASSGRSLYVSNRGHNSIAVFRLAESTGVPTFEQATSTEGDWPRNFALDPTERWLLVANQRSDSIIVFARDPESGRLTPTRQRMSVPSPVCLRFRDPAR